MMNQIAIALSFGLGLPGTFGAISLGFAIRKDGSPFRREFWTS